MESILSDQNPEAASCSAADKSENTGAGDAGALLLDFDQSYSSRHLTLLKLVISIVPEQFRGYLALYIHYSEFQLSLKQLKTKKTNTTPGLFHVLSHHDNENAASSFTDALKSDQLFPEMDKIYQAAKPLMTSEELKRVSKLYQMFSMYQTWQQMAPLLSAMDSGGLSGLMQSMNIDPSQLDLFQAMFQGGDDS